MYADPELCHCLFHTDIILPVLKVSFIQGNHMSMILLHMLPALLDLLMLETKRSRYIYTDEANFLRKKVSGVSYLCYLLSAIVICTLLYPITTDSLDMDMVPKMQF